MKYLFTILALSAVALAQQSAAPKAAAHKAVTKTTPKTATPAEPQTFPDEPGLYAAFNTSMGRIVVKLYEKESPITVANFTSLARGMKTFTDPKTGAKVKRPFYNGLTFHRVIPGFMIQGGDPTGTGMGDGGLKPIPDEFSSDLKFDQKGRLAMANAGPQTGTCQFFITDSLPSHLNGKHTIFGQVVEGQDVVTQIAAVQRDANDKPLKPVIIKSVVIKRVGPPPAPAAAPKKPATSSKTGAKKAVPSAK
jgi:peptidyl-prolyl cis-trans isomerase A (cyclophilin A)